MYMSAMRPMSSFVAFLSFCVLLSSLCPDGSLCLGKVPCWRQINNGSGFENFLSVDEGSLEMESPCHGALDWIDQDDHE